MIRVPEAFWKGAHGVFFYSMHIRPFLRVSLVVKRMTGCVHGVLFHWYIYNEKDILCDFYGIVCLQLNFGNMYVKKEGKIVVTPHGRHDVSNHRQLIC